MTIVEAMSNREAETEDKGLSRMSVHPSFPCLLISPRSWY